MNSPRLKNALKFISSVFDIAKWGVLIALLLAFGGILVLISPFGQSEIATIVANVLSKLGEGKCTIQSIELKYFPSLVANGLEWKYQDQRVISCERLTAEIRVLPLFSRQILFNQVNATSVELHIRSNAGVVDIAKLFTKPHKTLPKPDEKKPPSNKHAIKRIAFGRIQFHNSVFSFDDAHPNLTINRSPLDVVVRNLVIVPGRISFDNSRISLPQVSTLVTGKVDFTHHPPYGFAFGNVTIPDSTIRRFVPKWNDHHPLAIDFDASHSPAGIRARTGLYLPAQSINFSVANPDAAFRVNYIDATIESLDLLSLIQWKDTTSITASIKGQLREPFSKPAFQGVVTLSETDFSPLSKLAADLEVKANSHRISLQGEISEPRFDIKVNTVVNNLLDARSTMNVSTSGSVHHVRETTNLRDLPDSVEFSLTSNGVGKKLPIDSIDFRLGVAHSNWYNNPLDTLELSGSYTNKHLAVSDIHLQSPNGSLAAKGHASLDGKYTLTGTIERLFLERIPQLHALDSSMAGLATLWFSVSGGDKLRSDSTKSAHFGSISGRIGDFKQGEIAVDTIHLRELSYRFPETPYFVSLTADSVRTKQVAALAVDLVGQVRKDSFKLKLHASNDTIGVAAVLHGAADTAKFRFTAQFDSLFLNSQRLPIQLLEAQPVTLSRAGIHCPDVLLDTPFGITQASFSSDTSGNLSGNFAIDQMALQSLLAVAPSLKQLTGEIDLSGSWKVKRNTAPQVSATVTSRAVGWAGNQVLDTLKLHLDYANNRASWILNGQREGVQALASSGVARLNEKGLAGFDSLTFTTIEMPSRWFSGFLPPRSSWDGTLSARVENDQATGLRLFIDVIGKRLVLSEVGIDQRNVVLHAQTEGNSLVIRQGQAKSGGGDLDFGGKLTFKNFIPDSLDFTATASRFRFYKQARKSVSGDLDLTVKGPVNRLVLEGGTTLTEARYDLGDESKQVEEVILEDDNFSAVPAIAAWSNANGSFRIDAPGNVWVNGRGINAEAKVRLEMMKTPGQTLPRLYGTVEILRGTVLQYGKRLSITTGNFTFTGDPTNPDINLMAEAKDLKTRLGVDIRFSVTGSALTPQLKFTGVNSDGSEIPELDIIGYLTIGRPLAQMTQTASQNGSNLTSEATTTATTAAAGQLANFVAPKLGLSVLEYRPVQARDATRQAAELEAGGYITDKLFFSLVTPVGDAASANKVRVEYQLLPWLRLGATRDTEGNQLIEGFVQTEWGVSTPDSTTVQEQK